VGKGDVLDLRPVGFIDDNTRNKGKQVNGYPVLGTINSIEKILEENSVSEVILTNDHIPKEKLDRFSQVCPSHPILLRRLQVNLEEIPT
jgi:FlaA1/EpsC-like NDP-sugar epimerase